MTSEQFFENFGYLADAPNGVQKLRELILQLAVRGKLVPQDPADEPAAKLLERIRAEKARLVKEKKIRKSDPLPPVTAEEAPYELPKGWEWARLGCIGSWAVGSGFPNSEQGHQGKPILFCKVSDMNLPGNERYILSCNNSIDESTARRIRAKAHEPGTVVFPKIGGAIATNKRRILTRPTAIDNNCLGITPNGTCTADWLFLLLTTIDFAEYQSGTSVPALSQGVLESIISGLPSLREQHRIVAKVDQLMALCDELEARQQKSQKKLLRLNSAALDRLTCASGTDDFAAAWQLVRDSFDLLYTTPETIGKLRQAILQLAVQGKLLAVSSVADWRKGVLGDVVTRSEAGWSPQCENRPRKGDEWGVLKVSAVSWDKFRPEENKALPNQLPPRMEYEVMAGDFLISRANTEDLVAKSVVVLEKPKQLMLSDKTVRLHFNADALPRFFSLVNNAPSSRAYYAAVAGGTSSSMKNVTRQQILALPVLIPPLEEQHRIVVRVDQLMALCDVLEAQLKRGRVKAQRMTAAAVQGILAA